jgi:CRP-like cAMP-binding protein
MLIEGHSVSSTGRNFMGPRRKTILTSERAARLGLRTFKSRPHLYDISPIQGLTGEMTIGVGRPSLARVGTEPSEAGMTDIGSESLKQLFGGRPVRRLERGSLLFRQDEPVTEIFFIVGGRLRMVRNLASGDRVAIHTGCEGELFAECELFANSYQCDAIAVEMTHVRACGKNEMLATLARLPSTMLPLLERVTHLLHRAWAMIELRNIRSADARVLQHLHLSVSQDSTVLFDRPLLDVAQELGLTREAYYRALAALAHAGMIKRAGRKIELVR